MLDPRIYRTGLIVAALALVVLAFSLRNQPQPLSPTLAPDAFNGQNVSSEMQSLAQADPDRTPGSFDDDNVATQVRQSLSGDGFSASVDTFSARTIDGTRTLENVVGIRPGMTGGSIVIVAPRDARGAPATAGLSGTATLLELARDLEGETLNRTVVLASISGSEGGAGAIRLAATLPRPVDAVIVLGDLAGDHPPSPIVLPWSTRQAVAPPLLRNTVASALAAQTPFTAGGTGLGGQFAHLAFPFTLGQQGPLLARGIPSVELSLSGETSPPADASVDPGTVTAMGRSVLETISALDSGSSVPGPSAYLLLDGKIIPSWAISLFVLALLLPVALTTVDGVARASRRGHLIGRSVLLVLAAAVPFLAALAIVLFARLIGLLDVAPPGPVDPGAIPLQGSGIAVLIVAGAAVAAGAVGIPLAIRRFRPRPAQPRRRAAAHLGGEEGRAGAEGTVAGLLVVMCVVTFLIWLANPFAALLLIPALHLWLWAVSPDLPAPLPVRAGLVLLGAVPGALVVIYYANGLGYGPVGVLWQAVLLIAGHGVSVPAAIEWCCALGCLVSAVGLCVSLGRRPRPEPVPVTVRGPVTYAGPGSLGGTKSALRR